MIGRVLAERYRILSSIGEGGMARVWKAQDLNTNKEVAVKVLRDEYKDDQVFVQRFEREALAVSRMTHPNIVNLLDVGVEEDGTRYLVIEYVSGKTLKQYIKESGAMRPEIAAQIIMRVLAAVGHAHANGVIHRDIKPQNILIDREGIVKVADFGIARIANVQTMHQDTETVMGSVHYFSPEQAKGAAVDEKSDLYSVGVVFYEMLTGQVPFTGETPVAIAMKHLQEAPVPPSEIQPSVSAALDAVVLHAMEKRPRNRYSCAANMLKDVKMALESPDTVLAAQEAAKKRREQAQERAYQRSRSQRRKMWLRRALLAVFALALSGAIVLAGVHASKNLLGTYRTRISMPNLIGENAQGAKSQLENKGLKVYMRYVEYELVPENVVADQSIAAGAEVTAGDTVTLVVCKSRYAVKIPNVEGLPLADAQETLKASGLTVGSIQVIPNEASNTMVISQDPQPNTGANNGDEVRLVVSGGLVVMPKLEGQTLSAAEQTIIAYGLQLRSTTEEGVIDPEKIGTIIRQDPAAYTDILPGSAVTLVLGAPADALLEADVVVDLAGLKPGQKVTVTVAEADGSESIQYSNEFEQVVGSVSVTLYSENAKATYYSVYFDDEVVARYSVTFE